MVWWSDALGTFSTAIGFPLEWRKQKGPGLFPYFYLFINFKLKIWTFAASFSFILIIVIQLRVNKIWQWLDSNQWSFVLEVTTLPTVPQPQPFINYMLLKVLLLIRWFKLVLTRSRFMAVIKHLSVAILCRYFLRQAIGTADESLACVQYMLGETLALNKLNYLMLNAIGR